MQAAGPGRGPVIDAPIAKAKGPSGRAPAAAMMVLQLLAACQHGVARLTPGCPPISPDGTVPGTCQPGSPGCKQGRQCQPRARNPWMPAFHILGNFTHGDGTQPVAVNDASAVIQYKGVWHVFHQFGQCGWAHAVSHDLAHWRNLRYPLTPDNSTAHSYDAKGSFDGSVTMAPGVNGGNPVILYDTVPVERIPYRGARRACGAGGWSPPSAEGGGVELGDGQTMAVARPADLADAELQFWAKDPRNPVVFEGKGTCFPSQIWRNGDHWNFIADGQRWKTTDPTFHTWTAVDTGSNSSEGFPPGGNGGQWFQPLPLAAAGQPPHIPSGGPNRVVSVLSGNQYVLGRYDASAERFSPSSAACSCCPIPPNCTVEHSHELDHGCQFEWAALQSTFGKDGTPRMMNIGWVTSIARRRGQSGVGSGAAAAAFAPPGSALSLLREINYDSFTGKLIANPVPELALLRNATLFSAAAMPLQPLGGGDGGRHTMLPLALPGAGHTADVSAQVSLHPSAPTSFGISVLAHSDNISDSATVRVNIAAPDSQGVYHGVVRGRVELPLTDCPWENWWECAHPACLTNRSAAGCPSLQKARAPRPTDLGWNGSFSLAKQHFAADCEGGLRTPCVTLRILVDRSVVEVFVGSGQVSALMAYEPPSLAATQIHMFTAAAAAAGVAPVTAGVEVHSMGCGWDEAA
jgi:sucrose-6-phosphate hydrolase SacC (GH32 family)